MKCISRSITLLVSSWGALPGADACAVIDGSRILAGDLAALAPAFAALPADKDLGPAPMGTMVRVFYKAQLAALLPGQFAELPDRLCVQRKRDTIPAEAWQLAVESAMEKMCTGTPWKAKVLEVPHHKFPSGELQFVRSGVVASRGSMQLWRGTLALPDKSSIPVWVRVEIQTQRRATIVQRPLAAGAQLTVEDFREEEIWAPGVCRDEKSLPQAEGMIAKRTLAVGAELTVEDLKRAPAVHRGQPVELEAGVGTARLRLPAVAEHDAEVGEKVQVKSSWNGSKLVGRVTGAQKAKVE